MTITTYKNLTYRECIILDICQLVPAILSLVSCITSLSYFYRFYNKSQIRFRHMMILILLISDLVRSIILFLFPWFNISAIIHNDSNSKYLTQNSFKFCSFVGFMVNYSFDINDLINFFMAVHTALLIFQKQSPSTTTPIVKEAGLYPYRYATFALLFAIPLILTCIVFVDTIFKNYISFCYVPLDPLYVRLVSSWGVRYFVILSIFIIYIAIYIYIYQKYKAIHTHHNTSTEQDDSFSNEIKLKNLQDFNDRRNQIMRNLKYIFIYPLSYFFVWFTPMVAQSYRYSEHHQVPFSLFCCTVWFQLFDGFVQSCVFFNREKPWRNMRESNTTITTETQKHNILVEYDDNTSDGTSEMDLNDFLRQ